MGLHDNLGVLIIGTWLYSIAWGSLLTQVYRYFQRYRYDSVSLKAAVVAVFICETTWLCLACAAAYRQSIQLFGNQLLAERPSKTLVIASIPNGISMLIVNCFLIWRYYMLAKRLWLSAVFLAGAVACFSVQMWGSSLLLDLFRGRVSTALATAPKIALSLECAVVLSIALALILYLLGHFKTDITDTRRLLRRLILITFECGAATTALAALTFMAIYVFPATLVALVLGGCTGRCAALTMLFNLNMRESGGHLMNSGGASEIGSTLPSSNFPLTTVHTKSKLDGTVSVHQTMQVRIEEGTIDEEAKEPKFSWRTPRDDSSLKE